MKYLSGSVEKLNPAFSISEGLQYIVVVPLSLLCGSHYLRTLVPLRVNLDQFGADPEARLLIARFYGLNANIQGHSTFSLRSHNVERGSWQLCSETK
jgi:hypothetical protein